MIANDREIPNALGRVPKKWLFFMTFAIKVGGGSGPIKVFLKKNCFKTI